MNQNQILNLLLVPTSLIVLCNNVIFNTTPELFPKGSELGYLLSRLSLAYISSYIFYLIVVKYKEREDRKNIYPTVYRFSRELIGRGNSVITLLAQANGDNRGNITKVITKDEFLVHCKNINPKAIHPNICLGTIPNLIPATFGELIHNDSYANIRNLIEKVFIYKPFLASEFIKLLNQLLESKFFLMAEFLKNSKKLKNTDFLNFADAMFEYHLMLRDIEVYVESNIKKYIP